MSDAAERHVLVKTLPDSLAECREAAGDVVAARIAELAVEWGPFMAGKRCKGHFYLGARRLDAGDLDGYRQHLELAVET